MLGQPTGQQVGQRGLLGALRVQVGSQPQHPAQQPLAPILEQVARLIAEEACSGLPALPLLELERLPRFLCQYHSFVQLGGCQGRLCGEEQQLRTLNRLQALVCQCLLGRRDRLIRQAGGEQHLTSVDDHVGFRSRNAR